MNGNWICVSGMQNKKNIYWRARRTFTFDEAPAKKLLHIAAESHYRLWVNGFQIGMGPARGSRTLNFYDTWEVSAYLRPGTNHIAVLVQCMNIPNYNSFPAHTGLCVELQDVLVTDQDWEVLYNEEWAECVPLYTFQTGFSEQRDLRAEPVGWQIAEDSATWGTPEIMSEITGKRLLSRPIPLLQYLHYTPTDIVGAAWVEPLKKPLPPAEAISSQKHILDASLASNLTPLLLPETPSVTISPSQNNMGVSIVLDFGREVLGFLCFEVDAPAGITIDIAHDEELVNGRINACRREYRTADRYITRNGVQQIGNTLHERGFRFIEILIHGFNKTITLGKISAVDRRYPFTQRGKFFCSDSTLNRIWDVCVETMRACTSDMFTDCPWRERAFWVNDLLVENIVSLQAFGDGRLNAHALRLAMSNRRKDGLIPGVCPDSGDDAAVLLPTNFLLLIMLRDYFLYTGDITVVQELLPQIQEVIRLFDNWEDENGLICGRKPYWTFLDWSYELSGVSLDGKVSAPLNWLRVHALDAIAWMLQQLGRTTEANTQQDRSEKIAEKIDRYFWLEEENSYADWIEDEKHPTAYVSELNQVLALLIKGLVNPAKRNVLLDQVEQGKLPPPELYMHHFVLEVLRDAERYEAALERIRRYWGDMMLTGTPTLWESYVVQKGKTAFGNTGSLCHGFAATPVNYFQTAILGVIPLSPGFKNFSVRPAVHDLDFAEGQVPTPAGSIRVKWRRTRDGYEMTLDVPSGLQACTPAGKFTSGQHIYQVKASTERK